MLTECKEPPITEAVGDSVINELRSNKLRQGRSELRVGSHRSDS